MLALGLPFKAILPEERLLAGGVGFCVDARVANLAPNTIIAAAILHSTSVK